MDTEELKESGNAPQSTNQTSLDELQTNDWYMNTKIWIRGNDKSGYAAGIGDYRITDIYEETSQVKELLNRRHWDVIINLIAAMIEAHQQHEEAKIQAAYEKWQKDNKIPTDDQLSTNTVGNSIDEKAAHNRFEKIKDQLSDYDN